MADSPLRLPILPHPLPPPPPSSSLPPNPSLQSLLGAPLTLTLTDGRTIIGYFACVDQQCNIVLRDAEEFRKPPEGLAASLDRAAKRREARRAAGGDEVGPGEEEAGQLEEDAEDDEEVRVWKNREAYWPQSEPFGGYGSGWGGRSVGLVAAKEKDVVKIEVPDEVWRVMGGKAEEEKSGGGSLGP